MNLGQTGSLGNCCGQARANLQVRLRLFVQSIYLLTLRAKVELNRSDASNALVLLKIALLLTNLVFTPIILPIFEVRLT